MDSSLVQRDEGAGSVRAGILCRVDAQIIPVLPVPEAENGDLIPAGLQIPTTSQNSRPSHSILGCN